MIDAKIFFADLKAALEEALGAPVELRDGTIFKGPGQLPLSLYIQCRVTRSHQEVIGGEPATVVDDFKIVSAQLIQEQEEEPCQP